MSLSQLQAAVAHLIRLPSANRGPDLPRFLSDFELTPAEIDTVKSLSMNPKVAKYGRSMAGVRWDAAMKQLILVKRYLSKDDLNRIWNTLFEPEIVKLPFHRLVPTFLEFLLSDPGALSEVQRVGPPFILDAIKFEHAEMKILRRDISPQKTLAHPESLLQHEAFILLNLDYFIPEVLELDIGLSEKEAASIAPEKRPVILLMLGDLNRRQCRYFEIDEGLKVFLQSQLGVPTQMELPDSYSTLVDIGLCKALS